MMNIGAFKTAHHLHNRVHFANVTEKLVAQSFARAGAFHQPGDIDELDRSRHDFLRMRQFREDIESRVGHRHHADVRIDRAKGIIFRRCFVRSGDGVKERRFPDVRQSDNSSAEHEVRTLPAAETDRNGRPSAADLHLNFPLHL